MAIISQLSLPSFKQVIEIAQNHVIPRRQNDFKPYVLHHRSLWFLSALLIVVKVVAVVVISFAPPVPVASSAITPDNILSLTNDSREQNGLGALSANSKLARAAQAKADDMLARQYFAHITPDGKQPWDFISATGYAYQAAGENLAINFVQAEEVETAWMNSPGHRANILNTSFREIGIGISTGTYNGNAVIFVVQMFGTPPAVAISPAPKAVSAPKLAPAPKPSPTPKPVATSTPISKSAPKPIAVSKPAPAPKVAVAPTLATQPAPKPTLTASSVPTVQAAQTESKIVAPPLKISVRGPESTGLPNITTTLPVEINDAIAEIKDGKLFISTTVSGAIATLTATSGSHAFSLQQENGKWVTDIAFTDLVNGAPVMLVAVDKSGKTLLHEVTTPAASIFQSYSPDVAQKPSYINFVGWHINSVEFQNTFYSLFIALLLFAMMLAIAVRPRIQHMAMIAHASVVVALAAVLWSNIR